MTGSFLRAARSCASMLPVRSAPDVDLTLDDSDNDAPPPNLLGGGASKNTKKRAREVWSCQCGMDNDTLARECALCDARKPTEEGARPDETSQKTAQHFFSSVSKTAPLPLQTETEDSECMITAVEKEICILDSGAMASCREAIALASVCREAQHPSCFLVIIN